MTTEYRATHENWDDAGAFASDTRACLLELRARVETLEGMYETQRLATLEWGKDVDTYSRLIDKLWQRVEALEDSRNKIRSGPESPLVERVADAIAAEATSAGIVNDRPARAAILEVSKWLAEQSNSVTGQAWAAQLEIEAG